MTLPTDQAVWIYQMTGGKVKPAGATSNQTDPARALEAELQLAQAREMSEEQALKEVLLDAAVKRIEKDKDLLRKTQQFDVTTKDDGPLSRNKTEKTRDKKGRQERAFEAGDSGKVKKIGGVDVGTAGKQHKTEDATNGLKTLVEEKDKLVAVKTKRSFIDAKSKPAKIAQRDESLFSDKEIMDELYTPLVRELVLAETFIPAKFSATQKMIDGSDEYYVKECREKGKQMGVGAVAFAKGAVTLAASVTTTVLGALAPVSAGQQGLSTSGTLSKNAVAQATDITNGIAATLTGTIDLADTIYSKVKDGSDFPKGVFTGVLKTIGNGIGLVVAGATGDKSLGLVIGDAIGAGASAGTLVESVVRWRRDSPDDDPPWEDIINAIGGAISSSYNCKSDQTSGDESTAWANLANVISLSYGALARASKQNLIECIRKGQWDKCFDVLADTAVDVGKAIPGLIKFNDQYNSIGSDDKNAYADQGKLLKAMNDYQAGADKFGSGAEGLLKALGESLGEKIPLTSAENMTEDMQKIFEEKQKKISDEKEKAELADVGKIEDRLKTQKQEYKDSLVCLGSTNPSDAEYKTIAKLIAQLERDQAIWNGLTALFGGAIGAAGGLGAAMSVAAEVAAPLKAAGQLVKYIVNLKAAADRLEAFLEWKDAQTDAVSAVSPYATSIDNFVSNQGSQFTHYTLQAAANAIQALLACGEMSPYAPAFKVAGAAVGAAAAAEDLVYKFYKQVALRKAWSDTKEALDPKNKGNRKMALLARQINPTLAKFTIAYGAMIAKDPIAITALNRIGLDRETLAREKDKVGDVRKYLDKLYSDDGTVVGMLPVGAPVGKVKVPDPQLTVRAWSLSIVLWQQSENLDGDAPALILGNLTIAETLLAGDIKTMRDKDVDRLLVTLIKLATVFRDYKPVTKTGEACAPVMLFADLYADLAETKAQSITLDRGAANEPATVPLAA